MEIVRLENICKELNGSKILKGINLVINTGDFISLCGASGCGKTTTLNIIGAMTKPTSGDYFFEKNNILEINDAQQAKFRSESIGFIFQSFNLLKKYSVYENIRMAIEYASFKQQSDFESKLEHLLDLVGLKEKKYSMINELSGGQMQRVAIVRALIKEPKLILADEPTGNLDSKNAEQILELLKQLNEDGATILMVTHDENIAKHTHRTILMKDGEIL